MRPTQKFPLPRQEARNAWFGGSRHPRSKVCQSDSRTFQQPMGLLYKIVCSEMYLPVCTDFGGWYIYRIFHVVIYLQNVPTSWKRTYW